MSSNQVQPTGLERSFDENEIIVSKTDLKGRILYVNDVFCRVGLFAESELIGQPHSLIRHPDMPRSVFKLLWDTVQKGQEIFAYVKNMAKSGDHYWVLAHVTPTFDAAGKVVGYHSSRRKPDAEAVAKIDAIYGKVVAEERRHDDRREGLLAGGKMLQDMLSQAGMEYDQFVFQLTAEAA